MKLAIAVIALAIIATTIVMPLTNIRAQIPAQLPANIPPATTNGDHLPVHTVQDDRFIVTTVTKSGEPPTGPVIIIPPEPGQPGNGTIITPGENITTENPGNITIISPGGNITELPGNITNVGNDTVIITPPDRNVTETPGNVTVISPPLGGNETVPAPCTCQNQTVQQPPVTIPPVIISPAPGQNVTTTPQPPAANNITTQPLPPVTEGSNQTGNTTGNETQTNPINNATNAEPPHAAQLPASLSIMPQFHQMNVKYVYNGVNNQWLNH